MSDERERRTAKRVKAPRTVADLIALLQKYPAERRLAAYNIEVRTDDPRVSDIVAEREFFSGTSEAWLP